MTWSIAQFREDFRLPILNRALTESKKNLHRRPRRTQRYGGPTRRGRPTRRDRSNIADARFLDMPRRIAQERVPRPMRGSRDVIWATQPTPLVPFRVFFVCFAGPIP